MFRRVVCALAGVVLLGCSSEADVRVIDTGAVTTSTTPPTTVTRPSTTVTTSTDPEPTTTASSTIPPTTLPDPPPDPATLSTVRLSLEPLADLPLMTAGVSDQDLGAVYLTSQSGEVWLVGPDRSPQLVLDLRGVVSPWVENSERGLLGIAISPADDRLYVSYTDGAIDSHVVSYARDAVGRPDPESAREVLFIDQPGLGHKGGGLTFDDEGTLYLASGDGGASSGRDAQDLTVLLGGIVRVRPAATAAGYDIPPDNPFIGRSDARPELWAKGLRNPWGFCRDPATGDLWFSDVGNKTMEEINRMPPGVGGLNFGWPAVEGTFVRQRDVPADAMPPVFAYRHDDIGPAAIGGCVYRGSAIPALRGAYVFADITGVGFAVGAGDVTVRLPERFKGPVTGFVTLPDGELALLTLYSGAFRIVPG